MAHNGEARISLMSFRTQLGMLSGPIALLVFNRASCNCTESIDMMYLSGNSSGIELGGISLSVRGGKSLLTLVRNSFMSLNC